MMKRNEIAKIQELLDALEMICNGLSTDRSHYERLAKARDAVERLLRRSNDPHPVIAPLKPA
jgi:hypothetical protein